MEMTTYKPTILRGKAVMLSSADGVYVNKHTAKELLKTQQEQYAKGLQDKEALIVELSNKNDKVIMINQKMLKTLEEIWAKAEVGISEVI